jgi:hypothetical protein
MDSKAAKYGEDNRLRIKFPQAHQYIRAIQKNNLDGGSLPEDTSLTDRKIRRPVNQQFATFFCSFCLCNLHVG